MINYINIYKTDNFLNCSGGVYTTEEKAIESGKCVKGYICTVPINLPEENK